MYPIINSLWFFAISTISMWFSCWKNKVLILFYIVGMIIYLILTTSLDTVNKYKLINWFTSFPIMISCMGIIPYISVTWVLMAEIFPNKVRAVAASTFSLWVGSATLTYTFPLLNKTLGSYGTFWIYSAVCMAGFIFIKKMLPETKDKSLEELENTLIKK